MTDRLAEMVKGARKAITQAHVEAGKARYRLRVELNNARAHIAALTESHEHLEQKLAAYRSHDGDPWRWVGDGSDDLTSLACPILIHADQLRELMAIEFIMNASEAQLEHIFGPDRMKADKESGDFVVRTTLRIADLEQELEKARASFAKWRKESSDRGWLMAELELARDRIAALKAESSGLLDRYDHAQDRIAALERENAELRDSADLTEEP